MRAEPDSDGKLVGVAFELGRGGRLRTPDLAAAGDTADAARHESSGLRVR